MITRRQRCVRWLCALVWMGLVWMQSGEARASFHGAVSGVSRWLQGPPRARYLTSLSKAIFKLDSELSTAPLGAVRKKIMSDVMACMAAYAVESIRRRRYRSRQARNWYGVRFLLRDRKRSIALLLNHQTRLRRCLLAIHRTKPWSKALAHLVDVNYLSKELRSISRLMPTMHKRILALSALVKRLKKLRYQKAFRRLPPAKRRDVYHKLLHRTEGLFLQLDGFLLRRQRQRYAHGPSRLARVKLLRKLWRLCPVQGKMPQPINGEIALIAHSTALGTFSLLSVLLAMDTVTSGGGSGSQAAVTWGLFGGCLGLLAAMPAISMIMQPQDKGSNIMISVLSGALLPALGASLAFSKQDEAQVIGYGLLGSLPFHGTWLILGWINQARWRAQKKLWSKPLPPSYGLRLETRL